MDRTSHTTNLGHDEEETVWLRGQVHVSGGRTSTFPGVKQRFPVDHSGPPPTADLSGHNSRPN